MNQAFTLSNEDFYSEMSPQTAPPCQATNVLMWNTPLDLNNHLAPTWRDVVGLSPMMPFFTGFSFPLRATFRSQTVTCVCCSHLLTNGKTWSWWSPPYAQFIIYLSTSHPSASLAHHLHPPLSPTLRGLHEFHFDSILPPEPLRRPFIFPSFSLPRTRKPNFLCLSRSAGHLQVSLRRFISFLPLSTAL